MVYCNRSTCGNRKSKITVVVTSPCQPCGEYPGLPCGPYCNPCNGTQQSVNPYALPIAGQVVHNQGLCQKHF